MILHIAGAVFVGFLMQSDDSLAGLNRCGPFSLQVCALAIGRPTTHTEIAKFFPPNSEEATLAELEIAAKAMGLATLAVRWKDALPSTIESPAIIPVVNRQGRQHFVAMLRVDSASAQIIDFPGPAAWVPIRALREQLHWEGYALHLASDPAFLSQLTGMLRPRYRWVLPTLCLTAGICFVVFCLVRRAGFYKKVFRSRSLTAPGAGEHRAGFTLVEVLVCIGIIGMLVALIVPAVQQARESARRAQCQNNLRQLMQGCQNHHAQYATFPGTQVGRGGSNQVRNLSVHFKLLPFVDQRQLYDLVDQTETGEGAMNEPPSSAKNSMALGKTVPLFECPSDVVQPGGTSYRVCIGTSPSLHTTVPQDDDAAKAGAFDHGGLRDAEFRDGVSNTIFFSEKLVGDRDKLRYTPWRDFFMSGGGFRYPTDADSGCRLPASVVNPIHGSFGGASWLFSGHENTWYNHIRTPNSQYPDCLSGPGSGGATTARSNHPGGVNVVLGDGSIRFVSDSVNLKIWRALSTSAGGDIVPSDY